MSSFSDTLPFSQTDHDDHDELLATAIAAATPISTPTSTTTSRTPTPSISSANPSTSRYPAIPKSLENDQEGNWIVYRDESKRDFERWWLQTVYAKKPESQKIRWDGKKGRSDMWNTFSQVAHFQTGEPKIKCHKCGSMLAHPSYRSQGSNTQQKHYTRCLSKKAPPSFFVKKQTNNQVRSNTKSLITLLIIVTISILHTDNSISTLRANGQSN